MKILIALCLLVPILANRSPTDVLPEKDRVFLKQVHDTCQANKATYEDEQLLKKLLDNLNKPQVQIHMECMAKEAGLQKRNGELDLDVIAERIAIVTPNKADVPRLVKKCAVKQETSQKTGVLLWACFVRNDIPYYHVIL